MFESYILGKGENLVSVADKFKTNVKILQDINNIYDINDLRASRQLIAQVIAASIIVFYGDIVLTDITAFSLHIEFGIFKELITIFFIVACINIINFTDGLDGLSGGVTSIFYITTAIICFYQGRLGSHLPGYDHSA